MEFEKPVATFDQIPSELVLEIKKPPPSITIADEIDAIRNAELEARDKQCTPIKRIAKDPKFPKQLYMRRLFCVCPRYKPKQTCTHSGDNVILDRDVLSTDEHICLLATPKLSFKQKRQHPWYYYQKITLPNCTTRVSQLAAPPLKVVKDNLQQFQKILKKRHRMSLEKHLKRKSKIQTTSLKIALAYIREERRLERVAKRREKRRCLKMKRCIVRKQRAQIRKIILVMFEELKDFLLNDQLIMDQTSTLSQLILEQIEKFTDEEFYATNNLREFQAILANNLTVWINKFMSNLNIQIPQRPGKEMERPGVPYFLPLDDYIPKSNANDVDEEYSTEADFNESENEGEAEQSDILVENESVPDQQ